MLDRDPTALTAARFLALLCVGLALVPAGAHLFALPNKIGLDAADYLVAQQAYRGWALFGVVIAGALAATLGLALLERRNGGAAGPAWFAFACIAATQVIFWSFTFPANRATENWTLLPPDWEAVRARWEYSHAVNALLTLCAFVALLAAVLFHEPHRTPPLSRPSPASSNRQALS